MSQDLFELMSDVRDRVIRIETQMETLPAIKEKVDQHEEEIIKARASVNVLRWVAGAILVSVPTSVYAVLRSLKG